MPDMKVLLSGKNPFKNAGNTALVRHAGKCLALYEVGLPHEIRFARTGYRRRVRLRRQAEGAVDRSPKVAPTNSEMLGFSYAISARAFFHQFDPQVNRVRSVPSALERPLMMHDFAITAKYAIFFDLPQNFDLTRAFAGKSPLYFDEGRPARFGLLPHTPDAAGK